MTGQSIVSCPIQPNHIDTSRHFWNSFDKSEAETDALIIVKYCQSKGAWVPFTRKELADFYYKGEEDDFHIAEQLYPYLKQDGDTYSVTPQFIGKCYAISPKATP